MIQCYKKNYALALFLPKKHPRFSVQKRWNSRQTNKQTISCSTGTFWNLVPERTTWSWGPFKLCQWGLLTLSHDLWTHKCSIKKVPAKVNEDWPKSFTFRLGNSFLHQICLRYFNSSESTVVLSTFEFRLFLYVLQQYFFLDTTILFLLSLHVGIRSQIGRHLHLLKDGVPYEWSSTGNTKLVMQ